MFKMVIVGTAHMHCNEIALYIHEHPDAQLCGVADLTPEMPENTNARYTRGWNLNNIVETYGAKAYDDYRVMLDEVKPDLAFVLCENDRKRDVAMACCARKVNFSLEKPMSISYEDAKAIAQAAEEAGVEAMVNWPVIWRPYVNHMMKLLSDRVVGEPIKVEYANGHTGPLGRGARHRGVTDAVEDLSDETRSRTWWYQERHGGGVFLDILCYGCMYTRWILGADWRAVTSMGMNLDTACSDCPDNAAAIARFDHQMSVFGGTWTTPNPFMMTGPAIFCKNGVIYCSRDEAGKPCVKVMDIYGNNVPVEPWQQGEEYNDLVWNYIHHKKTGAPLHLPAQIKTNVEVISLLDASMKSAKNHQEVEAASL